MDRVRDAQKRVADARSAADPADRVRAEKELAAAKLEAAQAQSQAKRAGSGDPGDTAKFRGASVGTLFDGYA